MPSEETKIHIPTPEEMEALDLSPSEKAQEGQERPDESGQTTTVSDDPEQLRAQCQRWKDRAMRAVADYQNLQRRSQQERAATARYALADFVKALLPIIDDLERTLDAANEKTDPQSLRGGVRLIYENLIKLLQDNRVERIAAVGQPFDPTCHDAVMAQPCDDKPDKTVLRELAKGYRLADRVLRPSKVVISQAATPAEAESDVEAESADQSKVDAEPNTEE